MCCAVYDREGHGYVLCTYILGHPSDHHSWWTLQQQDLSDASRDSITIPVPRRMAPLVEAITSGLMDEDLEVLLAAAHGRKRARHGR